MVILITGASHTGKTVLAQRMLEKYQYPYLKGVCIHADNVLPENNAKIPPTINMGSMKVMTFLQHFFHEGADEMTYPDININRGIWKEPIIS